MAVAASSQEVLHHKNLYFESYLTENEAEKDQKLIEFLRPRQGNTIVYCATSNAVEYVHQHLQKHGIESLRHHKRMRVAQRRASVEQFLIGKSSVLAVAGPLPREIGKAHIRLMVHFNFPASLGDYIHETSPVGADGLPARCILLYLRKDKRSQKRDEDELKQVIVYAQSAMCRTKILSRYIGNMSGQEFCNRCDNCLRTRKSRPVEEKKRIDLDAILEASL